MSSALHGMPRMAEDQHKNFFVHAVSGERQIYFKCDLRKMRAEKIPAPSRERSAIFVFTRIKVYIITIMGHLVLSISRRFIENLIGKLRNLTL